MGYTQRLRLGILLSRRSTPMGHALRRRWSRLKWCLRVRRWTRVGVCLVLLDQEIEALGGRWDADLSTTSARVWRGHGKRSRDPPRAASTWP